MKARKLSLVWELSRFNKRIKSGYHSGSRCRNGSLFGRDFPRSLLKNRDRSSYRRIP